MTLLTGGAGYIGSHVLLELLEMKEPCIVVDNLSTGDRRAIPPEVEYIQADLQDLAALSEVCKSYPIDTIIHLAASTDVAESTQNPSKYYQNNVQTTEHILECCKRFHIQRLLFSSSAAVYGKTDKTPISEESSCYPESPYGETKLLCEQRITDYADHNDLSYVIFRYFNVAGADPQHRTGQRRPSSQLIQQCLEVAAGQKPTLSIYGTTYDTPDGTCIRDFIHVADIAFVHQLALRKIQANGGKHTWNVGYRHGYSVLNVVHTVERVTGKPVPLQFQPPREGDMGVSVADNRQIKTQLNWTPQYDNLDQIILHAWKWKQKLLV